MDSKANSCDDAFQGDMLLLRPSFALVSSRGEQFNGAYRGSDAPRDSEPINGRNMSDASPERNASFLGELVVRRQVS